MFHSPAVDDSISAGAVMPTFDSLLVGPADDDDDAGDSTAATAYVWGTRAWLPATQHHWKGKTL
ncbi:hypothetical protein [Cryobacterium sp. M96]|uniref:hypothetical protein n=1 Tax=Cryobacterium sp. M96 TaxID=2048295 RepID=UPI000CE3E86A|nr:hypothetical protein [Cryobacterium sp. M96]